jgi:CheY-like chemotaxis protein
MKTILVINDSDSIIDNISQLIILKGHKVHFAKSAEEGIAIVNSIKINMIIYNIEKHCSKAYELFEGFSKNARTQFIPFIFINSPSQIICEENRVYESEISEELSEISRMRSLPFVFMNALSQNKGKMILMATLDSSCFICPFDDKDFDKVISGNHYGEILNERKFILFEQFEKLAHQFFSQFWSNKNLLPSRTNI